MSYLAEILGGIVIFYFIHHYLIIDSSTSIMLDVELLISEVQSNPCLWDMSDKEYSNREVKKKNMESNSQKYIFQLGRYTDQ